MHAVLRPVQDAACERLAELALNDRSVARAVLCEAVSCSRVARAAADSDEKVEAFQRVRMLCCAVQERE